VGRPDQDLHQEVNLLRRTVGFRSAVLLLCRFHSGRPHARWRACAAAGTRPGAYIATKWCTGRMILPPNSLALLGARFVSLNGLHLPANTAIQMARRSCAPLWARNHVPAYPFSFRGSSFLYKVKGISYCVFTRHQTNGYEFDDISISLRHRRNRGRRDATSSVAGRRSRSGNPSWSFSAVSHFAIPCPSNQVRDPIHTVDNRGLTIKMTDTSAAYRIPWP
jgi:hypothetical protein